MTHRTPFLNLIKSYQPHALAEEMADIADLITFVENNPNCFEREHVAGAKHICISYMVVNHDLSQTLMLHHAKLKRWLQFGGHMDGNGDAFAVGNAELEEECGITGVKIWQNRPYDIARYDYPAEVFGYEKSIFDVRFLVIAPQNAKFEIREPDKCLDMRWLTPAEALALSSDNKYMVRLIDKWVEIASKEHKVAI